MRFRTNLPPYISNLLDVIQNEKSEELGNKPIDYQEGVYNLVGHFKSIKIVDAIFIAAFCGLYLSKEIPPMIAKYHLDDGKPHDFGSIDISTQKSILNHLIFCLWVREKGLPLEDDFKSKDEYRDELYSFLGCLLEDSYFLDVTIPFYLDKASNLSSHFIERFTESNYAKFESSTRTPEYIALEFMKIQENFYNYVFEEV